MSAASGSRRPWLALLLLCVWALAWQGSRGLFTTDEGRYTAVALNMLASGDWLLPRLSEDVTHYSKPPLTYWAIAASIALFGQNEWAARLPNALAFVLTVLLLLRIARRFDPARAPWAALIYATMALPWLAAGWISTDTLLVLFETLAAYGLLARLLDAQPNVRSWWALWAGLGLAFLTKGPPGLLGVAALLIAAASNPALRPRLRRLRAAPGLLVFVLIAAPWFVALILREPGLLWYFLQTEVADRVLTDKFGRSPGWLGLLRVYLPTLLLGTLPWSLRLLCTWRSRWRWAELRVEPGLWLPLGWLALPLLVFFLAQSRMPLYLLPLWVPISLLLMRTLPVEFRLRWPDRALLALWCVTLLTLRGLAAHIDLHTDDRALAAELRAQQAVAGEYVFVEDAPRFGLRFYLGANIERARINAPTSRYEQGLAQLLAEPPRCRIYIVKPSSEPYLRSAASGYGRAMHAIGGNARLRWYRADGDACPSFAGDQPHVP